LIDHDVHCHTLLSSCCNDERMTPPNIIAMAAQAGLSTIGFADHFWDSSIPGASPWYKGQDWAHVSKLRDQIPPDTQGLRVLFGCESEYCGDGKIGISAETASLFDFVLLPMSHFHMSGGFTRPKDLSRPADVAALLMARLREVVKIDFITGIAHPLLPIGFMDYCDEILAMLDKSQLRDTFAKAAEMNISIELNAGAFPGCNGGQTDGCHDESLLRILSLAKEAGCCFHFGSDAHSVEAFGRITKLAEYAEAIGIGQADIHPLFRSQGQ